MPGPRRVQSDGLIASLGYGSIQLRKTHLDIAFRQFDDGLSVHVEAVLGASQEDRHQDGAQTVERLLVAHRKRLLHHLTRDAHHRMRTREGRSFSLYRRDAVLSSRVTDLLPPDWVVPRLVAEEAQ
jgi:hypothetical protein